MAYTAWTAGTAFSVGDVRRATTSQNSGIVFECIGAGTSGSSEPAWPTSLFNVDSTVDTADADAVAGNCLFVFNDQCVIAGAVVDGTVTWKAISSVYEDVSVLAPSAIIELFELHLDSTLHGSSDVYRFHAGSNADVTGNIVFDGNTYARFPIQADGFEMRSGGTLPQPTLTVANLDGSITTLLALVNATTIGNDLTGATVKRIRTLKRYLDGESTADPNAKFPTEIWRINRKASETRDAVSFELASEFDLAGQKLPKRQIIANTCQWIYRKEGCNYTGSNYFDVDGNSVNTLAQDVCGKRIASCKLRFGENGVLPFGSFPGAGLTR